MGDFPPKVYPPGWNDPPMLTYSSSNPPPKSRITNKRVAFPVASSPGGHSDFLASKGGAPCIESIYSESQLQFTELGRHLPIEDVAKINRLLEDWKTGQFAETTQRALAEFARSLIEKNGTNAKQIHFQLAMSQDSIKQYLIVLQQLANIS